MDFKVVVNLCIVGYVSLLVGLLFINFSSHSERKKT
jgi:RsiW-degrading membrane proteinase PrsW (M82 family)